MAKSEKKKQSKEKRQDLPEDLPMVMFGGQRCLLHAKSGSTVAIHGEAGRIMVLADKVEPLTEAAKDILAKK